MPATQHIVVEAESSPEQFPNISCPPFPEYMFPVFRTSVSIVVDSTTQILSSSIDSESQSPTCEIEYDRTAREIPTPINNIDICAVDVDDQASPQSIVHVDSQLESNTLFILQHSNSNSKANNYANSLQIDRFRPNTTSSFLRPGARFTGVQKSDKAEFQVTVDVQHVDMANSYMCGYLNIRGLSNVLPTLTTYFEGEMIGNKYTFVTEHPEWGACEKIDWQHWARFPAWRPFQHSAKKPNFVLSGWQQKQYIWMRWKEYFIIPDHTVRDLTGASFDGFYYICFNQLSGNITGAYYHAKSVHFQQIELKPELDNRRFDYGFEFR